MSGNQFEDNPFRDLPEANPYAAPSVPGEVYADGNPLLAPAICLLVLSLVFLGLLALSMPYQIDRFTELDLSTPEGVGQLTGGVVALVAWAIMMMVIAAGSICMRPIAGIWRCHDGGHHLGDSLLLAVLRVRYPVRYLGADLVASAGSAFPFLLGCGPASAGIAATAGEQDGALLAMAPNVLPPKTRFRNSISTIRESRGSLPTHQETSNKLATVSKTLEGANEDRHIG